MKEQISIYKMKVDSNIKFVVLFHAEWGRWNLLFVMPNNPEWIKTTESHIFFLKGVPLSKQLEEVLLNNSWRRCEQHCQVLIKSSCQLTIHWSPSACNPPMEAPPGSRNTHTQNKKLSSHSSSISSSSLLFLLLINNNWHRLCTPLALSANLVLV